MHGAHHLVLDLSPSKFKLYIFITLHVLAMVSILFVSAYGVAGVVLQVILTVLLGLNLKYHFCRYKENVQIHLKPDNLINLIVSGQEYNDLNLSGQSYVSTILMQLVLQDKQTGQSHYIMVYPDSIGSFMRSQLRAKLKYSFNLD